MITQRIDKIALDIEQGINTTQSETKGKTQDDAKSDKIEAKEGKTELEAIAAKGVSVPEPEIEEEHFYHRGR
jgi:hypothetical protein